MPVLVVVDIETWILFSF